MKKKKASSRAKAIALGFTFLCTALGAGVYLTSQSSKLPIRTSSPNKPETAVHVRVYPKVKIYVLKIKGNDAYLSPEVVKVKQGTDLRKAALQELLETNRWEGESKNLIPKGTRLLSLNLKDGIAIVDLSKEFVDNFNGGSEMEALTVHSIVHTLTQFSKVKAVRFLVEGEKLETLGGHLDISEPVEADSILLESGG